MEKRIEFSLDENIREIEDMSDDEILDLYEYEEELPSDFIELLTMEVFDYCDRNEVLPWDVFTAMVELSGINENEDFNPVQITEAQAEWIIRAFVPERVLKILNL